MDNQYGTEYSYSFWIFMKDTNFDSSCDDTNYSAFKHVFHRGSYDYSSDHLPLLQNTGVWLYPNTNKFHIRFNTYQNVTESCDVGNIPINAWVHVTILLIGNSVDVFINANLKKRQKLRGVPKLNYENLYISIGEDLKDTYVDLDILIMLSNHLWLNTYLMKDQLNNLIILIKLVLIVLHLN